MPDSTSPNAGPTALPAPTFDHHRRIRFLDHLAINGNARAAAAYVGVSHMTAYRTRRQDPEFAGLWDAALVHARGHAETVLATRALDGVEVAIVYHGEITGFRTHHDPRLLLAHLARLDREVEANPAAQARAERFDELLAGYAGHAEPEGFADAVEETRDWRKPDPVATLPPTRRDYVVWQRSCAIGGDDHDAEAAAMAEAGEAAGEEWDEWRDEGLALVGAIVAGQAVPPPRREDDDDVPDDLPYEIKSAPPRARVFRVLDRVTRVTSAPPAPANLHPRHSRGCGNPAHKKSRAASSPCARARKPAHFCADGTSQGAIPWRCSTTSSAK